MNQKKNIIVFAPHPDDETFGCGGTIARRINEGFNVFVVILTDGRNLFKNMLNIVDDPLPEEVKEIRRKELLKATEILGVSRKNLIFLEFEDGSLGNYVAEAEARVKEILSFYQPFEVYFPFKNDAHPDHQVANKIVRECVKKLNLETKMYQYCILHKFSRFGPLYERILGFFKRNIVKVDISRFINVKEMAIREFKSEFSIISSRQSKPLEDKIDKYLKKDELYFKWKT